MPERKQTGSTLATQRQYMADRRWQVAIAAMQATMRSPGFDVAAYVNGTTATIAAVVKGSWIIADMMVAEFVAGCQQEAGKEQDQ